VSLFGVAIMEGLLLISYFNALRAQGLNLHDSIIQGATKRVRPVMITAMTAILGLLPAAFSTKIGSQTQRPWPSWWVGGMTVTLFLDRYLMPVLYSSTANARRQPAAKGWHIEQAPGPGALRCASGRCAPLRSASRLTRGRSTPC